MGRACINQRAGMGCNVIEVAEDFLVFAGGDGDCESGGIDHQAMAFKEGSRGFGFRARKDRTHVGEGGELELEGGVGKVGVGVGVQDPIVRVVVDQGIGWAIGCEQWGRDGGRAEDAGDVAGDELEHAWGLGLTKEACGVVVEGIAPANDDIGGHGLVKRDLVETGGHVGLGEVGVGGEEGDKVSELFIANVGVLGSDVNVARVDQ